MKRGDPPKRKTPLNRGTSRLRRGALNRQSERTREAAAKPAPKNELLPCQCWCGQMITRYGSKGRERRFAYRHYLAPHLSEAWQKLTVADTDSDDACWEWPGGINEHGYGVTKRNGENYVHRAAWVAVNGPIPEWLDVLHRCDNPPCYRPAHLFLGTIGDNVHDMMAKGRARMGETKPREVDVDALVQAYNAGAPLRQLAKQVRTAYPRARALLIEAGVEIRTQQEGRKAVPLRERCGKNHEFTAKNTYLHPKTGARQCRKCKAATARNAAKQAKLHREERRARQLVTARSGSVCEVCGIAPMNEFQHRKAVVHGGPWDAANGLAVCGHGNLTGCHGRIHQNPTEAYDNGWSVRSGHDLLTQPVLHAVHGLVFLDADGGVTPTERSAA